MPDPTPLMADDDRRQAEALSEDSLRPPLRIPGYERERFLGRGAFGEVWVAVDANSGRTVAIKYYNRRGEVDWGLLAREVEKLRHLFTDRHVVQLLAVGWNADPPYYVMEFMENGSLEDRLKAGPMAVEDAVETARDVARGLVHAHGKGILHCDLKPANVLLDQDGKPRLADFGQARLSHEQTPSLGTLFYMAPEQADLNGVPDARWDVYALGALLYCMLTGSPPYRFDGTTATAIMQAPTLGDRLDRYRRLLRESARPSAHRRIPEVDAALADIVDRCLAVDPKQRYPNVEAVLAALDARSAGRARRPLLVLGAVAPALILLVIALAGVYLFRAAVASAEDEVIASAMESNRFAARSVAERFALDIDRRWRLLEARAADPELARRLVAIADVPADTPAWWEKQAWFQERLTAWHRADDARFTPSTAAYSWFVNDRDGWQVARSPLDKSVGKNWSHRDYFHGKGWAVAEGDDVTPIRRPHRSVVFRSSVTGKLMVAFSVPVWPGPPGEGEPVGVLAMTSQLGRFAEWEGTGHQFAVLVDTRADVNGGRGLIVEHPVLEAQQRNLDAPAEDGYASVDILERARRLQKGKHDRLVRRMAGSSSPSEGDGDEDLRGDYDDPLERDVPGGWLVAVEPVVVPHARDAVLDTDWVVLVEQKTAEVLAPVQALRGKLFWGGLLALAVVLGVVGAVWAFVVVVLDQTSASPVIRFLRRRLGLASDGARGTGATGSLTRSASVQPRVPATVPDTQQRPT